MAINLYTSLLEQLSIYRIYLTITYLLPKRNYETGSTQPSQDGYVVKTFLDPFLVNTSQAL